MDDLGERPSVSPIGGDSSGESNGGDSAHCVGVEGDCGPDVAAVVVAAERAVIHWNRHLLSMDVRRGRDVEVNGRAHRHCEWHHLGSSGPSGETASG